LPERSSREERVGEAGWTYLVATHLGTIFLLAMFALLGRESGSLDFADFGAAGRSAPACADLLFLLAVVGFGTKAGFMPLHVWLPEAHPAAPSHVSAVMSGVMIKMGIYGLLRTLMFLGPPPTWWGWLPIAIGLVSGVLGVLFALAQHDLKRLLAYHSVENIGIIALGLGVGLLQAAVEGTLHVVLSLHSEVPTCGIPEPLETIVWGSRVLRTLIVSNILCHGA
jgi:hydrogenase-4 component B